MDISMYCRPRYTAMPVCMGDNGRTPAKSPCPETGGKGGAGRHCRRGLGRNT